MSKLDACNAAVEVINHYILDDDKDFGVSEVGAYPSDSDNPTDDFQVRVFYGGENAVYPPSCTAVIAERLAKAGLDVTVIYELESPVSLQQAG